MQDKKDENFSANVELSRRARPVALVGMMGSGKSAVGRRLAESLDCPFYDADAVIEDRAGKSIAQIFETQGEPAFRDLEKKVIEELLSKGFCVIATGGGAVADQDTRARLEDKAVTVWLRAGIPEILKRVGRSTARPLLKNGNPAETLRRLLESREPLYAQADIAVDTDGLSPAAAAQAVKEALYARFKADSF